MADDFDDEGDDESSGSGGGGLRIAAQYTTPEARKAATDMIDTLSKERSSINDQETSQLRAYETQAQEARQVLNEARQRLLAKHADQKVRYLQQGAAWLQPTRSGSAGEAVGNVMNAEAGARQRETAEDDARQREALGLSGQMNALDTGVIGARLKALQNKRVANTQLARQALTIASKPDRANGSAASMSKYGKIARDEGLSPESPEFQARVTALYNQDLAMQRVKSGTDIAPPPSSQAKHAIEDELGVPVTGIDPWGNLSTKDKQRAQETAQKAAQQRLDKLADVKEQNNEAIRQAMRFKELNKTVNTSALLGTVKNMHANVPYFGDVGQAIGQTLYSLSGQTPEEVEMDKLQNDLARSKRLPGERFTNYDQQMLQGTVMGRDKPQKTNESLANAYIAAKQLQNEHILFLHDYLNANHHLEGAEAYWDKYLQANPIFDQTKSKLPDQKGNTPAIALNKNRMNYKQYFKALRKQQLNPVPAPADAPVVDAPAGMAKGGLAKEALQGATAGFGDELFDTEDQRRDLEETSQESPMLTLGAQGAGAAGTALAARAALKHAIRGGGRTSKVAQALMALSTKHPIKKQMAIGATVGGIGAEGAAEPGADAPVASSAVIGGIAAPLTALMAKHGVRGIRALKPGRTKVSTAEKKLLGALPDSAQGQMQSDVRARVPTVLADVPDPKMQQLTQDTLRHPGEHTGQLADSIETRQAGARGRTEEAVNQALKPDRYFAQEKHLTDQLYANARPLYEAAFAEAPSIKSPSFDRLAQLPEGQEAIKYAQKRMQLDLSKSGITQAALPMDQITGARSQAELDRIAHSLGVFDNNSDNEIKKAYIQKRSTLPAAAVRGAAVPEGPSLEFLDYVKKGMDSQIDKAYRAGDNNMARLLRDHRDALKGDLDAASPTYTKARAQYAGDLEVRDALHMGREEFDSLTPEEFEGRLKGMSFAERDALRSGLAQKLFEKINNPTSDANYSQKLMGSPSAMAKYKMVFDKPSEYEAFANTLNREAELYDSSDKALRAAGRGQGQYEEPERGSLFQMMHGLFSRPGGMSDATANELAQMLGKSKPRDIAAFMADMRKKAEETARAAAIDQAAGTAGAAAAGAMTMTNPRGHLEEDQQDDEPVPQMAEGGEVSQPEPHKTHLMALRNAARSLANSVPGVSGENADDLERKPSYVAAGIASNLGYGIDDKTGELVPLSDILMGNKADLGIVESAKSLPTFAPSLMRMGASALDYKTPNNHIGTYLRGKLASLMNHGADAAEAHMPEWAARGPERAAKIREKVLQEMGLPEPQSTADEIADVGGQMLGQLPLPGKKAEVATTVARTALQRLKTLAGAVPEYLGPTIRPSVGNYATGTAGGYALGHIPDIMKYLQDPELSDSEHAAAARLAKNFVNTGHAEPAFASHYAINQ